MASIAWCARGTESLSHVGRVDTESEFCRTGLGYRHLTAAED